MTNVDQIRTMMAEHSAGLLHPQTSEEAVATFDRVLEAVEDVTSYLVILSWFAAAGAGSLQLVRDRTLPPELAGKVLFSPHFGTQASGEPRTPAQTTAAQIITATANEDFPMAIALAGPYVEGGGGEAGALLSEMAHLARVMHQGVCGGGH
ncbi:hypothetical protein LJR045_000953 [Microbacterium sp. LjRoot45]|uniref:hypothetical protein n=1 Tax=Microbacterium sp. LjRoot45 TaxID=3342329 RepID=UPI003ECFAD37